MDNSTSFINQYVSGTANGSSCEEETFTEMCIRDRYQTMKEIHEKKADVFSESEIEHMYLALAGEVLEAEKNKRFGFRKKEV